MPLPSTPGRGTGHFRAPRSLRWVVIPSALLSEISKETGHLDFGLADSANGSISLFLNDGAGNFLKPGPASSASGVHPTSIVAGDFNGDGSLDLAVADSVAGTVTVLIGDGFGNFTPQTSSAAGASPASIVVGDFNGDGKLDVAVSNANSNMVSILLGRGDGTFTTATTQPTGLTPQGIAAGNFNGQSNTGLAVANLGATNAQTSTVTVLLSQVTQTATATAGNITVAGSGTHLIGLQAIPATASMEQASPVQPASSAASSGISQTITFSRSCHAGDVWRCSDHLERYRRSFRGNPVIFSTTGPCSVASSTLTITGVGSCVVFANQAGSATYAAATQGCSHTIIVSPAVLTVAVAGAASRLFGQPNPVVTHTIGPFVNGDTQASATTGTPSLTTAAMPKSPAGNYQIAIGQGTLSFRGELHLQLRQRAVDGDRRRGAGNRLLTAGEFFAGTSFR